MKAQASSEFLLIVGVLTLLMVPLLLVIYINANGSPDKISISKATFSAARIASSANSVGAMGIGSQVFTTIEVPPIESVSVGGHEVVFTLRQPYGPVTVIAPSHYRLHGVGLQNIKSPGVYTLLVTGPGSYSPDAEVTVSLR